MLQLGWRHVTHSIFPDFFHLRIIWTKWGIEPICRFPNAHFPILGFDFRCLTYALSYNSLWHPIQSALSPRTHKGSLSLISFHLTPLSYFSFLARSTTCVMAWDDNSAIRVPTRRSSNSVCWFAIIGIWWIVQRPKVIIQPICW